MQEVAAACKSNSESRTLAPQRAPLHYLHVVAGPPPTTAISSVGRSTVLVGVVFVAALIAAFGFPQLDHAANPSAPYPGLVSFLGVGLSVLALTAMLLFVGLRKVLPRSGIFLVAAFGYNAMLVSVKFGLGPAALYGADASNFSGGFQILTNRLAYPGLAAITAILYGLAFFVLYLIYRRRMHRRIGAATPIEHGFLQLLVAMFVLAVVGGVTVIGLLGFLEYAFSVFFATVLGLLIAVALLLAIVFCSVAFKEAADQAALLRNVTLFSTFAWVGLAFIAAFHILWLVFLLTLISIWPLHAWTGK